MAKVDLSQLGAELGVTQANADYAIAELERQLGYPLCGSAEPEERIFPWRNQIWHRVNPLYELVSVVLVRGGQEQTITDYQLGQNGKLWGDWFNAFKLCNTCRGACTHCGDGCDYIKVTAKWGFGAPETVEESGDTDRTLCYIPDDLYNVLSEAANKAAKGDKNDLQSENTGTRSYSKFAASYKSTWLKYVDVIEYYKMRAPRAS